MPETTNRPVAPMRDTTALRAARITALLYIGLAVTGALGFLLIRPSLFEPGSAAATLANLVESPGTARFGIGLEMAAVVTQALVALWFFRLFRAVDAFGAGAIAVFGLVNAVAILSSAALSATALAVALESVGDPGTAHVLLIAGDNFWGVGNLFFGLWLIPMGWCVLQTLSMPRALGWVLILGGVGYVLAAFLRYLAPDLATVTELLAIPATIGELWIIGYLLLRGLGRRVPA